MTRLALALQFALSLALLAPLQDQDPTSSLPPAEARAAFLARLPAVLRGEKAPKSVHAFTADVHVRLTPEASEGGDGARVAGDVDAEIAYLEPRFVRTRVLESDRVLTRGHDEDGPWQDNGQRAYRLSGKDYERDRKAVLRERSTAVLMTRYLYAERELAALTEPEGPTDEVLTWGRLPPIDCVRIGGVARDGAGYPLALSPGRKEPVRVTVWFRRDNLHPVAIRLQPLDTELRPDGPFEELRLFEHKPFGDLLLPARIELFGPNAKGKLSLLQQIKVRKFQPNPATLTAAEFRMPG
jgi:hypothetical protein